MEPVQLVAERGHVCVEASMMVIGAVAGWPCALVGRGSVAPLAQPPNGWRCMWIDSSQTRHGGARLASKHAANVKC